MTDLFAAYVRTSSDENQTPEDSKRWQLSLAEALIAPKNGRIVAVYHDVDVSRSLPWVRRAKAKQLLDDLKRPARGWTKLVIGEPQRAFSGAQFQLVFPILCHYGVELWVPEVGGPLDPDSEAHDLVMSLFGGLSKAERRRVQHRTRASVLALATTGRWLGGRTNYGYLLADTAQPHPNKRKAAAGVRLRTLVPDPDTAPVVKRIFAMYDAGWGYRAIAGALEGEGIPSPGEVGPTRHPRSAGVWTGSAVRAILLNPRYLGHQVAGRLRRHDLLLDPQDPAMGTISRMRWQDRANWATSDEVAWPPLVDEALFKRVNARIVNNPSTEGSRRPRSAPGRYLFAGVIRCDHCGKSMFGAQGKNKPYYKCESSRPGYARPNVEGHPPSLMVREERIAAAVDGWLSAMTDLDRLDDTIRAIVDAAASIEAEPPEIATARRDRRQLQIELDRVIAAIRAGMDPMLAAGQTRQIQAAINTTTARIDQWERTRGRPAELTEDDVRQALIQANGLVGLLAEAPRPDRAELYRSLGLSMRYRRNTATGQEVILARSQLTCSGGRI